VTRVRGASAVGVGRRGVVCGGLFELELSFPFETEMEGSSRAGICGLVFRMPPELPGRESGGEFVKSRTMPSPGVVERSILLVRDENRVFFSSATRWALGRGVRPAGGVQRPPPTAAGVEAPDSVDIGSKSSPVFGCVALRTRSPGWGG
jgi:hypothetical protein